MALSLPSQMNLQSELDEESIGRFVTIGGVKYFYNIHFKPLSCFAGAGYSKEDCDLIASGLQLWLAGLCIKLISTALLAFPTSYWYLVNLRLKTRLGQWLASSSLPHAWQSLLHWNVVQRCRRMYTSIFPSLVARQRHANK